MSSTLLPPHIPYGIHMEWIHSMWNPWIPHGFHMEYVWSHYGMYPFHGFHMDSTWNGVHSTWIPHGLGVHSTPIPYGLHSHSNYSTWNYEFCERGGIPWNVVWTIELVLGSLGWSSFLALRA